MKKLEPYLFKFNEDGTIKDKKYSLDCVIKNANWRLVIIIIYDKSNFFANNNIQKAQTRKDDNFLSSKKRRQGTMVLEFLLSFGRFNLFSLSKEKKKKQYRN